LREVGANQFRPVVCRKQDLPSCPERLDNMGETR
jgi:hypothetical protein